MAFCMEYNSRWNIVQFFKISFSQTKRKIVIKHSLFPMLSVIIWDFNLQYGDLSLLSTNTTAATLVMVCYCSPINIDESISIYCYLWLLKFYFTSCEGSHEAEIWINHFNVVHWWICANRYCIWFWKSDFSYCENLQET